jgi:hypothetical protein
LILHPFSQPRATACLAFVAAFLVCASTAQAFRVTDTSLVAEGKARWDAAGRTVDGVERSIDGGLRYSLQGGSYTAFRDQLSWVGGAPSAGDFQTAVDGAFSAWTITDPTSGLPGSLSFQADLSTPVVDGFIDFNNLGNFLGLNAGAEIDIFAATPHSDGALASVIFSVDPASAGDLTLTSGTTNYSGLAISGADIRIDPTFGFTLDVFQIVLTHEIGHTIGLTDVEVFPGTIGTNSPFFDNNYDGTNSATAFVTLTDPFAQLIDPLDPDSTPLIGIASTLDGDPGLATPGVEILMESFGVLDLLDAPIPLQNDDFAGRQYLYPVLIPEPSTVLLLAGGLGGLSFRARRLRAARLRDGSANHTGTTRFARC